MATKKFPKTIYVTHEQDGDAEYLNIREDGPNDTLIEETTVVARYELAEVGKVVVSREYVGNSK